MTVLILGGTGEARALAQVLCDNEVDFVSSLAGRVRNPRLPVGAVRIGGFGGVTGLEEYLRTHDVDAVVDATHPFAKGISANAAASCRAAESRCCACNVRDGPTTPVDGSGWTAMTKLLPSRPVDPVSF